MDNEDKHLCVICCKTIYGLSNYITHRKNGCKPEKDVNSFPNRNNNCKQENTLNENNLGIFVTHNSQPGQQPVFGGEELRPLVTVFIEQADHREQSSFPVTAALDLSCQNGISKVINEPDCNKSVVISSNNSDGNGINVDDRNEVDVQMVCNLSDKKAVDVLHVSDDDNCSESELNQEDALVTLSTSAKYNTNTSKTNEFGLLSAVIESHDKSKTKYEQNLARNMKSRKRGRPAPKCKVSTKADVSYKNNLIYSGNSDAFTKLIPNSVHTVVEDSINNKTKVSVKEEENITNYSDSVKEGEVNETMKHAKCEQEEQSVSNETTDNEDNNDTSVNDHDLEHFEEPERKNNVKVWKCSLCNIKFECQNSLLKHLLMNLSKDGTTKGTHEVLSLKYLSSISRLHPFQCGVCKFYFNRLDDFQDHLASTSHLHKTESIHTEITCKQCDIKFSVYEDLEPHLTDIQHDKSKEIMHVTSNISDRDVDNENELETLITVDPDDQMEIDELGGAEVNGMSMKYEISANVRFDEDFVQCRKPCNKSRTKAKKSTANDSGNKMINCRHCSYASDFVSDMKFHYLDQHIELTHKCDVCDIVFLTSGNYRKHSNSKEHQINIEKFGTKNSTQEFYQCHVCKKKFTSENYCNFHTALQHFHYKSEDCLLKQPSITRDKYADYLASIANESSRARCKCPDCGSVVSKNSMMAHLRLHTREQPFQCKLCVESYVNVTSLRRHLGIHFNIFSKSCKICGQQFKRIEHYNSHLSLHKAVAVDSKTHVCEICGTAFYLAKQLRAHLYKHQEKTQKCDFPDCQWSFHSKHDLKMHKLTHSYEEKAFICATCGYTAKCKKYLKAHEKIHAKDVTLLSCQFCEYKARKNTHMRRHMRIHLGSKPYKCPYCSYACNTHDNIRKHILETNIHVGLKVYPCKFCEYSTNSTKEFRSHLRTDHSDLVDDGARSRSLSSFTGLFVESEDLSVPEEGMEIIPVTKRKNSRRSFKSEQESEEMQL